VLYAQEIECFRFNFETHVTVTQGISKILCPRLKKNIISEE